MFVLIIVAVAPELTPTIAAAVGVPEVETVSDTSLSVAAPTNVVESYFKISPRDTTQVTVSEANVPSATAPFSP